MSIKSILFTIVFLGLSQPVLSSTIQCRGDHPIDFLSGEASFEADGDVGKVDIRTLSVYIPAESDDMGGSVANTSSIDLEHKTSREECSKVGTSSCYKNENIVLEAAVMGRGLSSPGHFTWRVFAKNYGKSVIKTLYCNLF